MRFWSRLFGLESSYITDFSSAMEIGNRRIVTSLKSLDRRRMRKPRGDEFGVVLWHADQHQKIFVYPFNSSESTKPIGIIPNKYYRSILPFITDESKFISYAASFNRLNYTLTVELNVTTEEVVRKKQIQEEVLKKAVLKRNARKAFGDIKKTIQTKEGHNSRC